MLGRGLVWAALSSSSYALRPASSFFMFWSSGSGGAFGLGVASAVLGWRVALKKAMLSAGSPGEAMLCYQYVLCAAGGDEGSHSNCSGLNFKWARWTLLGQATTCGPAAPGPIWPSNRLDD